MIPDIINGCFELLGAPFILLSIIKVYRTRTSKGVNWIHPAFFLAWGIWNLFYYPYLDQWVSFVGGLAIVAANILWVYLLVIYRKQ